MPDLPAHDGDSATYPINRLQATVACERPQERLEKFGPGALSDTELLALLLRSGTRGQDVLTLAAHLIAEAGSLAALIPWRAAEFKKLKGIGRVNAGQIHLLALPAYFHIPRQKWPCVVPSSLAASHLR